ncbi:AraC family transcriptional regulator [Jiulongibacter sediminis]|uniref:HTH araC/xylS-type domain-containing protein n=1 Tax=Jiulongibacter sediminis TaxID=1605367 RepID=A0A0P7BZY1_9BACT|nr:AraC family transcriptional regulator [Jiulongibacter sediminis]KPM49953.1 hypothetical protein AFM12_05140 [Jiulongibacter sediminis]TBX26986.1 hypothetical protein TK44_05145 [Jiulongibacter sediminis]
MHFVSASIYHKAVYLALKEGLSPQSIRHHKDAPELQKSSKYIPISFLYDVYEGADQQLSAGFSVRQGMQLDSDDYGTLGLSWKTCWLAREVFDRLERFMILVTDHGNIRLEESGGFTTLEIVRNPNRRGVEMANEVSFVMIAGIFIEVTGKDISPSAIQFKHSAASGQLFEDYFQCKVSFDQSKNIISYKTADITVPTLKADKSIHQFLLERMNEEKEGIYQSADHLLKEIIRLITEALPSGIPSIIQVAEYLGLSARTLKRRLADKGLTFRELVQNIQQDEARNLLRNPGLSMGEIAFQTGFSEQSAFNRAFKRWTGLSPADYRKNS